MVFLSCKTAQWWVNRPETETPSSGSPARWVQMINSFPNPDLHSLRQWMPLGRGSTSLLTLGEKQCYFHFGHCGGLCCRHLCCGFILCFPDDQRCWTSLHLLTNHLNLLFPGVSFGDFQPLLKIGLLVIILLICRSLLYILDKNPWLDTYIACIYCSCICLFTLLSSIFWGAKFLI